MLSCRTPGPGDTRPEKARRRHPGRIRSLQAAGAAALAAGLVLWWALPAPRPEPSGGTTMVTGVSTGVYARYGRLLQERLARDLPRLRLQLQPSEGSVQNVQQVATGRADFTVAAADAVAAYLKEDGRGADGLRACARLYDDYIQLIVPADSPVHSTKDLAGLRVGVGEGRSGVQLIAGRLLKAAGLDMREDLRAVEESIGRMPGMLRRGELDAFFWSGGLPTSAVQRLASQEEIRLVQLGDLEEALHRHHPEARAYRTAVMPPDTYPRVQRGKSVKTIAVANLLVTSERTDAALTEAVTRSVIRSRTDIGRKVHAAQKVDLRTAIYTDPLPLHEGAARYYRSAKP